MSSVNTKFEPTRNDTIDDDWKESHRINGHCKDLVICLVSFESISHQNPSSHRIPTEPILFSIPSSNATLLQTESQGQQQEQRHPLHPSAIGTRSALHFASHQRRTVTTRKRHGCDNDVCVAESAWNAIGMSPSRSCSST